MSAESVAKALGGRRTGAAWMARCPAHDDGEPSLSIATKGGKLLLRCHAGCDQRDVINALRTRGLWPASSRRPSFRVGNEPARPPGNDADVLAPNRTRVALAIWGGSEPAEGTAVESYLRSRRLAMAPPAIRFHGGLKHPAGAMWPAMVALVTRGIDAEPIGIHRTFLAHDGAGNPLDEAERARARQRGLQPPD